MKSIRERYVAYNYVESKKNLIEQIVVATGRALGWEKWVKGSKETKDKKERKKME